MSGHEPVKRPARILIVIGAYGHTRMREYIFGGVTRTFIDHMTAPVLMSN